MKKSLIILSTFVLSLSLSTAVFAYSDVSESYSYKTAIDYLSTQNIVQGYENNTFQPRKPINRAEFVKIVVENKINTNPTENAGNCFKDVLPEDWYASYICFAKKNNIINGYKDDTFAPGNTINLAEAAAILTNAYDLPSAKTNGTEWYSQALENIGSQNLIPPSFSHVGQQVTRGEMAEIIWRINENKHDQESVIASTLQPGTCQMLEEDVPENVDMDVIRNTWLQWNNQVRASAGLHPYTINAQLNRPATIWSEVAKDRGYIDHRRSYNSPYYDYWEITSWFQNLGLTFANVNRTTHTENIGWGVYRCSESEADCTQHMINGMRGVFDYFMSEKNLSYRPHYNTIMNNHFNEFGLGVSVDQNAGKFYFTAHYGTRITSNPPPICSGSTP